MAPSCRKSSRRRRASPRCCSTARFPKISKMRFEPRIAELFPQSIADVRTECSCPDWSNPCKHVAAVYYLIGEEFDRDPFLLFAFRGLERDAILPALAAEEPRRQTSSVRAGGHILAGVPAAAAVGTPAHGRMAASPNRPFPVLARKRAVGRRACRRLH